MQHSYLCIVSLVVIWEASSLDMEEPRHMMQHAETFQTTADLGNQGEITWQQKAAFVAFVTKLYGKKCKSLHAFRCERAGDQRQNVVVRNYRLQMTASLYISNVLYTSFLYGSRHPKPSKLESVITISNTLS
mgnify:CR=1 FL=1